MNRDPVSGNTVPPGATAREVRDDVPILASENEYIIPANVVRFLDLDKIEKMVEQAKMKLAELDQKGRIGGDTGEDDLPFGPEELQKVPSDQTPIPQMATGGMVSDPNSDIDPATGLPTWLVRMQQGTQTPATPPVQTPTPKVQSSYQPQARPMGSTSDRRQGQSNELTGTAQSVAKWTPAEFNKYAKTRGDTGQAIGSAAASMVPFGALGAQMRGRYLERAVPKGFDDMLKSGKDLQGSTLSPEDLTQLRTSYDRVKSTAKPKTGPIAAITGMARDSGLIKRRGENGSEGQPERRLRDLFTKKDKSATSDRDRQGVVSRPTKETKQEAPKPTKLNGPSPRKDDKKK